MNQQKTGELLKRLRKEKGLTQEQLAEMFYVSSRTVSRWETGSNMPDVSILIELADFYDVDIREIIDGERKSEIMNKETKDTLLKVAEYAAKEHRKGQTKVLVTALVVCVALIVCTLLFMPRPGLLYIPLLKDTCDYLIVVVYGLAIMLFICYMYARAFQEKPSYDPLETLQAVVVSKKVVSGTHSTGRSQMGYSFLITFRTADNQELKLYAYEEEFGGLKEGMAGVLTYQGRYFVDFQ